jgi:hypothetical protein
VSESNTGGIGPRFRRGQWGGTRQGTGATAAFVPEKGVSMVAWVVRRRCKRGDVKVWPGGRAGGSKRTARQTPLWAASAARRKSAGYVIPSQRRGISLRLAEAFVWLCNEIPRCARDDRELSADLRRLRRKQLIRRLPHSRTYVLTSDGIRVAVFYTKVHGRLLRPLLAAHCPPAPTPYAASTPTSPSTSTTPASPKSHET